MRQPKIALIGAGNIGGTVAFLAAIRKLGNIVLFDVVEGLPQGKALDLLHTQPLIDSDVSIIGTNDYADIQDADVCIVTAGIARKPGMSRDDLLNTNSKIMSSVAQAIGKYAPNSFVIVVSNPLDAMVMLCQRTTGFLPAKVVGMAGVLDSSRYRALLAKELGVSPSTINAFVIGSHGDTMVPIRSCTKVAGMPVTNFLTEEALNRIEARVRNAGGEVVALLKSGSAYYSPATSALEMAESYLRDQKKVMSCAAYLSGQYGCTGIYLGVPVIIGRNGVEKVIELDLNEGERKALGESIKQVQSIVGSL